ncbi:hypothetical protein EVAR_18509_1 [Eumeta japonica]|uniref:Uncharacterized protein n=1 Tax=Eumeta variegata TaxID=151549 RepID=A0A4C1V0F0_EUMVA|nr:hypothetical protein EVAR_18509_1 [Eumeta japonica]
MLSRYFNSMSYRTLQRHSGVDEISERAPSRARAPGAAHTRGYVVGAKKIVLWRNSPLGRHATPADNASPSATCRSSLYGVIALMSYTDTPLASNLGIIELLPKVEADGRVNSLSERGMHSQSKNETTCFDKFSICPWHDIVTLLLYCGVSKAPPSGLLLHYFTAPPEHSDSSPPQRLNE